MPMPDESVAGTVEEWADRYQDLDARPDVHYVAVTAHVTPPDGVSAYRVTPHGEVPPAVQREIDAARRHYEETGECPYCRQVQDALRDGRVVAQNHGLVVFTMPGAEGPRVATRKHKQAVSELCTNGRGFLAEALAAAAAWAPADGRSWTLDICQRPTGGEGFPYLHLHADLCHLR